MGSPNRKGGLLKTVQFKEINHGHVKIAEPELHIDQDKVRVVISSLAQDQLCSSGGQTRRQFHPGTV